MASSIQGIRRLFCCHTLGNCMALDSEGFAPFELVEVFKSFSCAQADCEQWAWGDDDGKSCFLDEGFVEPFDQGAAAGEHHAALDEVSCELWRALFQSEFDAFDDLLDRLS